MEASFHFEEDEVPRHIDARPSVPSYAGGFAVFGATSGNKPYPLALDIPNEEMAHRLAEARRLHQEATIDRYGYSDDVYILSPSGERERVYYGRERDDG